MNFLLMNLEQLRQAAKDKIARQAPSSKDKEKAEKNLKQLVYMRWLTFALPFISLIINREEYTVQMSVIAFLMYGLVQLLFVQEVIAREVLKHSQEE